MSYSSPIATRIATLTLFLLPMIACAEGTVLTGTFDGSERALSRDSDVYGCRSKPAGYQTISFEVSQSGEYRLSDPYDSHFYWQGFDAGYTLEIYEDRFEPSAPIWVEQVNEQVYALQSDRTYSLVVHSKCPGFEGAWAAALQGPGTVRSDAVAVLPPFSKGKFTQASPTMTSDCGTGYYAWGWGPIHDAPYAQVGPIRLKRSGEYYYGAEYVSLACLAIYTAPVDPANRQANRVAVLAGFDTTVMLEADTDYWFVSHWSGWHWSSRDAEYLHVLVPPASFRIHAGLNGAWYNPATPGEGYFISVFDALNRVFLANFTYSGQSIPGDPYGHRWYTAAGDVGGNSSELDLELTSGGAFNAALPAPQQEQIGRLRLQFSDCATGSIVVDADTPDGPQSAGQEIPLQRLGSDWEQICRSQNEGLDEVGPL